MGHFIITDRNNNYDIDNPRDAYAYLIVECPNGMGAFGLYALNTLWDAYLKCHEEA